MKSPKEPSSSIEEQKQRLISRIDKIDLSRFGTLPNKLQEYRKLIMARQYEAADDLYLSTVMSAMYESDEKERYKDVIKGAFKILGQIRGRQKTKAANEIKKWLHPLLAECDAELPPERKNRGWKTLEKAAKRKVNKENLDDPRKDFITRSRIQDWIDEGRPKY